MCSRWSRGAVLFFFFPTILSWVKPHSWIYVLLWVLAGMSWFWMWRRGADWFQEWKWSGVTWEWGRVMLVRFVFLGAGLTVFTWIMIPDRFFSFPLERPERWASVMVWYPLFSAFPQEIIFRGFIFHYWKNYSERTKVIVSAFAFGWAHILLQNWVAVVFSILGGFIFAHSYSKTRSLAAVCIEHALYGCYIFTLGLGYYFYHGSALR